MGTKNLKDGAPWNMGLHDNFLAGANEPPALLANPVERRIELLFGLNTASEIAAETHRHDALAVDDSA